MWTPATRRQHSRDHLRYETDLTDAEWALIEPLMSKPKVRGRPWAWPVREIPRRRGLAAAPERPAAEDHGLSLVRALARHGPVRADQSRPGHGRSRARRARSLAQRRRARQPVGQDHRERRPAGLRCREKG